MISDGGLRKLSGFSSLKSLNLDVRQITDFGLEALTMETEARKEAAQVKLASFTYTRCFGASLTKAYNSLLEVLIGELQSKVAALVDPNFDPGELRTRRVRRKTSIVLFPPDKPSSICFLLMFC
ncbi:hypothetical protein K1719_026717 [Acacia pycnantha]|nr:hypothetical protein K1719_026717 [Acacia pycnantha]